LGYAQGTYTMTTTDPKTKKPVTDKGKYLVAYKKQADGTWKAVADMDSSDLPLPVPGKK
jgi:ketosteroid isomerase-like protein